MNEDYSQNPLSGPPPALSALFDSSRAITDAREQPGEKKALTAEFKRVAQTIDPPTHEFLNRRIVRITGPINDAKASAVITQMQWLADNGEGDIELRINSPGGSVTAGLAIYDAMKALDCDVKTTCEGMCASMAAVLLAAGTPGKRVAMPHSTIMVHGVGMDGIGGKLEDVKEVEKEMERLQKTVVEILSQYSGLPAPHVDFLMKRDNYLSAQDAKLMGLIDEVKQPRHQPPVKAAPANLPVLPQPVVFPTFGAPAVN